MTWIALALGLLVTTVAVSYLVEAARRPPVAPAVFSWAPEIAVRYLDVDGLRLRYLVAGEGPPLVLLHTLRTQLDMFQHLVPALAARFRVYALDHPGHGYSDIPEADYSADFFVRTIGAALDRLEIEDALVVGESIGGSIGLVLAARRHPRVGRVVAVNPYDYARGRGLRRSSPLANIIFGLNDVPLLGATVTRLRLYPIVRQVYRGGVRRPGALPEALAREMYLVGNRPGHARAFTSLVRHWGSWEAARTEYRGIQRPVLLVYGEHDWSREEERAAEARDVPGAETVVIPGAGHFLSLDAPGELASVILDWAGTPRPPARAAG